MAVNIGTSDRKIHFESLPLIKAAPSRPIFSQRKLSFPASLHANLLGISSNGSSENGKEAINAKRRFSNVGDVVSRKLSNTIGWRSTSVPPEEVISQGRTLCGQYIRNRLKRSGFFSKKLNLYRLRSVLGTIEGVTVREVYPFLVAAGIELERMYPKLYSGISRQSSMAPGGILASDKAAAGLLIAISHDLLKSDITWGKVVSVFAVAGGLAVDCVFQGHPEYLHTLMDGMTEVLEDDLADWVATNGGWIALAAQCRYPETDFSIFEYTYIIGPIILVLVLIYLAIRIFL